MVETFQDRLVTELRLAGASTIDQAKELLQSDAATLNAGQIIAARLPHLAAVFPVAVNGVPGNQVALHRQQFPLSGSHSPF